MHRNPEKDGFRVRVRVITQTLNSNPKTRKIQVKAQHNNLKTQNFRV